MRTIILAAMIAALVAGSGIVRAPHPPPYELDAQRERWFMEPREYPFGFVPANARNNAFESLRRDRRVSDAVDATAQPAWTPLGPAPVTVDWDHWKLSNGRVAAVAVSPADPHIVLIGAAAGGIWRSTDGGQLFQPVSDGQADLSVGAIAFAPSNPNIVYAGMGGNYLGTGVLKSTDAGATWGRVSGAGFALRSTTAALVVDPSDASRLLIAQWEQLYTDGYIYASGILLSEDGGASWRTVLQGNIYSLIAVPGSSGTLLASMARVFGPGDPPAGIYRSTDGGRTWSFAFSGPLDPANWITGQLAASTAAPGTVFWWGNGHFFTSSDAGATWSERSTTTLPKDAPLFVAASPGDAKVIYLGCADLYRSTDGGTTWANLTLGYTPDFTPEHSLTHVDQHALAFASADGKSFLLGNDGGLYRSDGGAATFTCLSGSIGSLVQFYALSASPADARVIFGGSQDNGIDARTSAGTAWTEILTGDNGSIIFDPNDPSRFLVAGVYGAIYRFRANGTYEAQPAENATFSEPKNGARISFIAPLVSNGRGTVYFGTWRLFATNDFGATWSPTAGTIDLTKGASSSDTLSVIAVAPDAPNVIYTGSWHGRVMRSTDAGATWTAIANGLPNRAITSIVPVGSGQTAYLSVSGFASDHIFRTDNQGASWSAIGSTRNGLPDIPVNVLSIDPANGSRLYAGTDIGVFTSGDAGSSWAVANNGMPPVVVTSFTRAVDGTLIAGTYGRGSYGLVQAPSPRRRRTVRH